MSGRRRPPANTVIVKATDKAAASLNAGAARTWNAGRRLAKTAKGPTDDGEDLDFNALSASLQAIIAHARRRALPDTAIALAIGASVGPIAATLPVGERPQWVERLARVIHASARMTEVSLGQAGGNGGDPAP